MNKIIIITASCFFIVVNPVWSSQTRMATFMAGDYIDDITNIGIYPHHIIMYENNLYGDITEEFEDCGLIIAPERKYGAFACWQNNVSGNGFNFGYAINLHNFDIGISGSPVKDSRRFGIGIGRKFFRRRFDLSFLLGDDTNEEWYKFNLRCAGRRGDFIIVPKYALDRIRKPYDHTKHRIGVMLQRLILNEGFVYFIAEYDFSRGDIEYDYTHIYGGLELPLTRRIILRCGVKESFTEGFESPQWQIEPGFSIRIREFSLDFHINKDTLFEDDFTFFIFNSFGLDLNFGRF